MESKTANDIARETMALMALDEVYDVEAGLESASSRFDSADTTDAINMAVNVYCQITEQTRTSVVHSLPSDGIVPIKFDNLRLKDVFVENYPWSYELTSPINGSQYEIPFSVEYIDIELRGVINYRTQDGGYYNVVETEYTDGTFETVLSGPLETSLPFWETPNDYLYDYRVREFSRLIVTLFALNPMTNANVGTEIANVTVIKEPEDPGEGQPQ